MAHSFRKTTLKFTFCNEYARPKAHEIELFLRDEVHIDFNDLIGINLSIVSSVVYVKLVNDAVCEKILNNVKQGLKFHHSDGHIGEVLVEHAGLGIRTIRIFELPFEVPEQMVTDALRPYGKVVSHIPEKWTSFRIFPVLNGVRQVRMELTKHVPSYLYIGGCRAIVIYDGQPRTCSGCGREGHVRSECPQRRITQLPRGEQQTTDSTTTLPLIYTAAFRGTSNQTPTQSEETIPNAVESLPKDMPQENSTENIPELPPPIPVAAIGRPETNADVEMQESPQDEMGNQQEIRTTSDAETRTRKQRSPKRYKKRKHNQEEGSPTPSENADESDNLELTLPDLQHHDNNCRMDTEKTGIQQSSEHFAPMNYTSLSSQQADAEQKHTLQDQTGQVRVVASNTDAWAVEQEDTGEITAKAMGDATMTSAHSG